MITTQLTREQQHRLRIHLEVILDAWGAIKQELAQIPMALQNDDDYMARRTAMGTTFGLELQKDIQRLIWEVDTIPQLRQQRQEARKKG